MRKEVVMNNVDAVVEKVCSKLSSNPQVVGILYDQDVNKFDLEITTIVETSGFEEIILYVIGREKIKLNTSVLEDGILFRIAWFTLEEMRQLCVNNDSHKKKRSVRILFDKTGKIGEYLERLD